MLPRFGYTLILSFGGGVYSLHTKMCDLSRAENTEGHAEVLFHYLGDKHLNDSGELILPSCFGKTIIAESFVCNSIQDWCLP